MDTSEKVEGESTALQEAKSIKCDICGKLFKCNIEVEFHASKSGHGSFSETTEERLELSEEDKKKKLQILEDKMRQKRKEREEKEKLEALEREKSRIHLGKEVINARKKYEEQEMLKMIELRKREKLEDKLARQRIKEQIEADRIARNSKTLNTNTQTSTETSNVTPAATITPPTNYNETKLQIRLTDGQVLRQNFGCKEQLSSVRLFIEINRTDGTGPFTLMTNFPRKVFTEADFDAPLEALGLVPSAVIIVQKK